ncbi:hypothetical protein CGCF415_v002931 [Colletotrichum fructicola]|uniref:Ricin b lectin n=1 Tax=Colletotrichum fructicola (strain Nara gc5) TaxID=1213859 RepID=A0A7J6J0A8_COLFN|nr:hypothetical protein CGGC5_v009457 [Colletotrichum fructicola Nara gc5]KAF4882502.1 hypothetical protein CGCFRS4_v014507 [Colletotrichum fructicola]KAF4913549.1 hypothetical protein CGCF415_v002931 [Colletotrichum fructicola]KAF4942595.1 hypothetical protein CGCF245_v000462 [Colletotrichum fructicola]
MKLSLLAVFAASVSVAQSAITWTLDKAANPTSDQIEAYEKIEATMKAAVARHAKLGTASKSVTVKYTPGVPTAEAGVSGVLRFGSDRAFMDERTALHEIAHKLGVGLTTAFNSLCSSGDWKTALPLLKSWDGDDAKISCGGQHIWPYGLNHDTEWSETNADRHIQIIYQCHDCQWHVNLGFVFQCIVYIVNICWMFPYWAASALALRRACGHSSGWLETYTASA